MTDDGNPLSPKVLYSSRTRTVLLVLGFLVATGFGVLMVRAGAGYGWLTLAFGVMGLAVFLFILANPNRLELSASGLTTVTLGRRWSVGWDQCGEFRTWKNDIQLGAPAMVVFDCSAPGVRGHALELAAEAISGANAALPETYGMSAADLAALLTSTVDWR